MSASDSLPAPPASLDRDGRAALEAYAARALLRQERALERATDEVFEHIPRALRGLVRRVLAP